MLELDSYDSDRWAEWYDAVENDLQVCMAGAGFEYYPLKYVDAVTDGSSILTADGLDLLHVPDLADDRSVVEQWGYGLDEVFYPSLDLGSEEASRIEQANAPNEAYRASLSVEAQAAYDLAMDGPGTEGEQTEGCSARAYAAHPEPTPASRPFDEAYYGLKAGMMKIQWWEVGDDPRVVQAGADWNQCMLRAGYDVSPWVMEQTMITFNHYASPYVAWTLAASTQPDGSQWEEGDLWGLQASEPQVRIALADFDCRVETDYEARVLAV
ncbi:MAG: hypothetical protein LBR19_01635, partial [Bifidobacteriaceae bacterium]|nr:hypothetical protein [Bifidobacteriaceae bacterium]